VPRCFRSAKSWRAGLSHPRPPAMRADELPIKQQPCCTALWSLMAQSRHGDRADACPLSGVKRTSKWVFRQVTATCKESTVLLQVDTSKMLRNKQETRLAVYLGPYSEKMKGLSTNLQSIGTIALVRGHLADGPFMHICIIFTNS